MKGKKYYIAYGDAAALTIKNAIYDGLEKATIVCFRDDFTQGPLPEQFDLVALEDRKAYWQSLSDVLYNVSDIDAVLDYSIEELNQIGQGSAVYLWTGDSAYDRLASMWLSVLLDQKGCVIFNNSKLSGDGDEKIINLAMLSPKTVAATATNFEIVHPMKISMWRITWKNLMEENGAYRVLENEQILNKDSRFMKDCIKKYIDNVPIQARDLIEKILTEDPIPLSDITIEYELRKMIKEKEVDFQGELGTMTDYKVFIPG